MKYQSTTLKSVVSAAAMTLIAASAGVFPAGQRELFHPTCAVPKRPRPGSVRNSRPAANTESDMSGKLKVGRLVRSWSARQNMAAMDVFSLGVPTVYPAHEVGY